MREKTSIHVGAVEGHKDSPLEGQLNQKLLCLWSVMQMSSKARQDTKFPQDLTYLKTPTPNYRIKRKAFDSVIETFRLSHHIPWILIVLVILWYTIYMIEMTYRSDHQPWIFVVLLVYIRMYSL